MQNNKYRNFFIYLSNPLKREEIRQIYFSNQIKLEKCELFSDFIQSLLLLTFETYLGDEVTNKKEQLKHFKWCWDKNVENFTKEHILITHPQLYSYFKGFMMEVFYQYKNKEPNYVDNNTLKLWLDIFDYTKMKTQSDMDIFLEVYKLMDDNLKYIE